jgi:hypothetical protein
VVSYLWGLARFYNKCCSFRKVIVRVCRVVCEERVTVHCSCDDDLYGPNETCCELNNKNVCESNSFLFKHHELDAVLQDLFRSVQFPCLFFHISIITMEENNTSHVGWYA